MVQVKKKVFLFSLVPPNFYLTMVRGRRTREWGEREKARQVARPSRGEGQVCWWCLGRAQSWQLQFQATNLPASLVKQFLAASG